jgi:hypothetical protein
LGLLSGSRGMGLLVVYICHVAYLMHKDQLAGTEVVLQRPKMPPKRMADYTVHGGQVGMRCWCWAQGMLNLTNIVSLVTLSQQQQTRVANQE